METINRYHKVFLMSFAAICLGHWGEHIFQSYQVWVMNMPRACALGMLGYKYPWLVKTEILHYGYALVMLVGLWLLRQGFTGPARSWWMVAFGIQVWHHFEHLLLITQSTLHHNFWGSNVPTSVLQTIFPKMRIELHLFYNTIVTIPMIVAMVLYFRQRAKRDEIAPCDLVRAHSHESFAS